MHRASRSLRFTLCTAVAVLAACPSVQVPELRAPGAAPVLSAREPLKVHLRSGQLLVLQGWSDLPGDSALRGVGQRFDIRRRLVGQFSGVVPRDSIALLEVTHSTTAHPAGSVILGVYTTIAGLVTVACLADPKSCFGSCPTFYTGEQQDRPVAEGFSGSVARSLEATDIDDLADVHPAGRTFTLTMRNEALETHAVRSLRLLVVPHPTTGQIVKDGEGRMFVASTATAPADCQSTDGDCASRVSARDGSEWMSRADSADLGRRDSIDLAFPAAGERPALLVTARQSFVSTYVFYQSLAWAGSRVGELLAAVERSGPAAFPGLGSTLRSLGRVEILVRSAGGDWIEAGAFGEPGPIASDRQAVPLAAAPTGDSLHVRLRFARGAWRFDELALVTLGEPVLPVALEPVRVERRGEADTAAQARLRDPARYLVTYPGDRYEIVFELPQDGSRLALFIESTGYYYEWMRPEWLREESPAMLALMATDHEAALKRMAPGYARLEPGLEAMFWSSRFGRR